MKNIMLYFTARLVVVMLAFMISSCKKDHVSQTYEYQDTFKFHYGFYPDVAGGWTPASGLPGWYPNTGTGNSAVMGTATLFFTIYAKFKGTGLDVDNIPVPVNKYYAKELAAAGIAVPDEVQKIVYDDKKNSIWFRYASVSTLFEPPTTVRATGELDIIGGSGKFKGATGHVREGGYFSAVDSTEGAMGIKGTITY